MIVQILFFSVIIGLLFQQAAKKVRPLPEPLIGDSIRGIVQLKKLVFFHYKENWLSRRKQRHFSTLRTLSQGSCRKYGKNMVVGSLRFTEMYRASNTFDHKTN